ncbi:MAG: phosphoglucomutase/phosphomannomutase family protein [Candidatus Bipolaricaulia bacterium]
MDHEPITLRLSRETDWKPVNVSFGTSGWRAVIGEAFTPENIGLVVQAIADCLNDQGLTGSIILGRDPRTLGEEGIQRAAVILAAHGLDPVVGKAYTPTPVISHAITHHQAVGGINLTASHNPGNWNGIKFNPAHGGPAGKAITDEIERRTNGYMKRKHPEIRLYQDYEAAVRSGKIAEVDLLPAYLDDLKRVIDFDTIRGSDLRLIADPMNGAGIRAYQWIFEALGGSQEDILHATPDPDFRGLSPEPAEAHLGELIDRVKRASGQALGIAGDPDVDRFGIVDRDGSYITPNQFIAIALRYLYEVRGYRGGAAKSVATTDLINAVAESLGIPIYETAVGFKWFTDHLRPGSGHPVILAGEESGGLSIRDWVLEKDGILAGVLAAEIVARTGKSLKQHLDEIQQQVGYYVYHRDNIPLTDRLRDEIPERFDRLVEEVATGGTVEIAGKPVARSIAVDGWKFLFEDKSWLLVRLSGTEPVARLYTEATSKQGPEAAARALEALRDAGKQLLGLGNKH